MPSNAALMYALRAEYQTQITSSGDNSLAAMLALAAGISQQDLVKHYSLLPFFRASSLNQCNVHHGETAHPNLIKHFGTRVCNESQIFFCPSCVKEDLGYWGFSYWCCSHQLPGSTWCYKHGSQLEVAENGKSAFDTMPFPDMPSHNRFSEPDFQAISDNPVVNRYVDIVNAFLDSGKPVSFYHARDCIVQRMKELKIRTSKNGRRPTLTDYVLSLVPKVWLIEQYPFITHRSSGEFFNAIDGVAFDTVTSQTYALALAVLFESSTDALNSWFHQATEILRPRQEQRSFGREYWNGKAVFDLYVEKGGNCSSVAEELEISYAHAKTALSTACLPSLSRVDMNTTARALIDFQEGMPLKDACNLNGASQEEVEKLLRVGASKTAKAITRISQPKIPRGVRFSNT